MNLLAPIRSLPAYQQLLEDLRVQKSLPGLALMRAARLPLLAALSGDLGWPVLVLTDRPDHALTLVDELAFWAPDVPRLLFPEPNPLFYEPAAWGSATRRDRMLALTMLSTYHMLGVSQPALAPVVVASARALMARTLPRRDFIRATRTIKQGQVIQPEALLKSWVDNGYQATEIVVEPGQFSRRGGILDLWPPAEPQPARVEFFGDEIDTLRRFDPSSQRTIQPLTSLLVPPAREVLAGRAMELGYTLQDVTEFIQPKVHPAQASLLDYLPKQSLVLVDDLELLRSVVTDVEEQSVKLRQDSIAEGTLPEDFPAPYLSWSEIADSLSGHLTLELGYSTAEDPSQLAQAFQPGPRFGGKMRAVMDSLVELCAVGERVTIVSRQAPRLKELWGERGSGSTAAGQTPELIEGTLGEGWVLNLGSAGRLHLLTDSEIFGWERPQPRRPHRPSVDAPEMAYADLKPGDLVVHVDHGIGRFIGLVSRTLEGLDREFLCVDYADGDQLYVPIPQADRLTRYIGADNQTPGLTRLGGVEWSQVKQHVRSAVEDIAHELLELYTRRQVSKGYAFKADSTWQNELEASFPYIETDDQMKAIEQVKKDMESDRPMDRLLCGDVGYGKTEVALRAAFKAVMDNRQVALLVPTTVLAQQHYDTFRQRLAAFPVEVEMLSRFRSPKEQDEILLKLATGGVDIIIGTHRLLSSDVAFENLGLVIIDEEQRFGVAHKEYLKKLRTEVDVLTLTATPIPRTLYMALTGVRDISTINTPPDERLPIITHIGPYSPKLVRQAMLRELERGGQIFFVHNRVQTIRAMLSHLNKLAPEARVGIGHGQMPEHELASVMHKFTHGEIDVLLCTSIIESGLDIPNANTLIVDRADTFGLAQLYQLRGRVGRGAQRAYAYFFRHKKFTPTVEGQERLEVIAENTQLGAGYSIAMRDLEIRGAGELLGTRQHGYIASIGFHLYTRMLSEAVRGQRKALGVPVEVDASLLSVEMHSPVSVELPLSVGLPTAYVPDQVMRLRLYRRIADLHAETDLEALAEEFTDRFGPLPTEVEALFYQIRVKNRAEAAGLASISLENDQLVLRFPPLPEGVNSRNLPFIGAGARSGKNAYWIPYASQIEDWQERLLEALSTLSETAGS